MVMAEKDYPVGIGSIAEEFVNDVKGLFSKGSKVDTEVNVPGSELPAFGKCGCHPGGIHHTNDVEDVEQRNSEPLIAIPVRLEDNIINVRMMPAKRSSMETFYPGNTVTGAVFFQGRDPKIARLYLCASAGGVWVGTETQIKSMVAGGAGTTNSQGFLVSPNNGLPPWEGVDTDLWCMAASAGAVLSVRREYWSDV